MKKAGLVSTIIPVFNRPELVKEAVASVLAQTYKAIEIIIVDDGSDDPRMLAALEVCCEDGKGKIKVLSQSNLGPGPARQRGLEEARGEFVQFLDSDDLLLKEKFHQQVAALNSNPEAGVSYGKTRFVATDGTTRGTWGRTGEQINEMFPSMLARRWWGTSTPLYRRDLLLSAGPINNLVNEEDWELDCRIAAKGVQLVWVDEWVSEQRALASERASSGGSKDPMKLRDRARARELILGSAVQAGLSPSLPEFEEFVRYSFLVARQCAAIGLTQEAERLVTLLNEAAPRTVMRVYLQVGKLLGLGRTTWLANSVYRLLSVVKPSH